MPRSGGLQTAVFEGRFGKRPSLMSRAFMIKNALIAIVSTQRTKTLNTRAVRDRRYRYICDFGDAEG